MPHHGHHHHHHHRHGGLPVGGLLMGAAVGGMVASSMNQPRQQTTVVYQNGPQPYGYGPPPPVPYGYGGPPQPQTTVFVAQQRPVVQPQVAYQAPPPEPFHITNISIPSLQLRSNGSVYYYQIIVTSDDLGPERPWSIWRRYKTFDELRESTYALVPRTNSYFPPKQGFVGLFSSMSASDAEERRIQLEQWLREMIQQATHNPANRETLRLQQFIYVFLNYRSRVSESEQFTFERNRIANGGGGGNAAVSVGGENVGGGMSTVNNTGYIVNTQQTLQQQQDPNLLNFNPSLQPPPVYGQSQQAPVYGQSAAPIYQTADAEVCIAATLVEPPSKNDCAGNIDGGNPPPPPPGPSAPPSF